MTEIISVGFAEDHKVVRKGIIAFINGFEGIQVDFEADNGRELIETLEKSTFLPDVCVLDISMPVMNGFDTAAELRKRWPSVKILALTMFHSDLYIIRMLMAGARGYILKNCDPAELKNAIIAVHRDGTYFFDAATKNIFNAIRNKQIKLPNVTTKELEVLKYFCTELSYAQIGQMLGTTARSVEGYRDSLFKKFHTNSRVSLVMLAVEFGLIPLERDAFGGENFPHKR